MMRFILFISIFVAQVFSDTFPTAIGECTLEIYGGRVDDIPEIVQLIKDESVILVDELGEVNIRSYSVYITSNMEDFYEKSKGPVPEWGIALAKLNPDRAILKSPGLANISFIRMKEVIVHELNHIYMFRIPNYYTMPSWLKRVWQWLDPTSFHCCIKLKFPKPIGKNRPFPCSDYGIWASILRGKLNWPMANLQQQ